MQHDESYRQPQRDLTDLDVANLSTDELRTLQTYYDDKREGIAMQIRIANERREFGGRFDEEWFNRACAALAHTKKDLKTVSMAFERHRLPAARDVRAECVTKLEGLLKHYKGEVRRDAIQRCIDAVLEVA